MGSSVPTPSTRERIWSLQAAQETLTSRPLARELLLGLGAWSHDNCHRICVLAVDASRPELLLDGHMRETDLPQFLTWLRQQISVVHEGSVDAMYATSWRLAWTTNPLRIWNRRGIVVTLTADELRIRHLLRWEHVPIRRIRTVLARGHGAVRTRLSLRLDSDEEVPLISLWRPDMLIADDWYDGHGDWMQNVGEALGRELGVPFQEIAAT
jgi:hypothetical protein